jgi:hypothetical protein
MLRIGRIMPGVALAGILCAHAAGQAPPSYGLDFVTVGAPGNRVPNQAEAPLYYTYGFSPIPGRVDYEFRIMRTEVNVTQWFEYVQAFAPFWQGAPNSSSFTSMWIFYSPSQGHYIASGTENYSANMSWDHAARYANWLHNGKVNEAWAFESGAYDLSEPVPARNPEARFWMPSLDERIKATYYDPDRYGPGEEGYWKHPGGSDAVLVSGHPWEGGETNRGIRGIFMGEMDVGSYPHITTPWGLLDASGGVREWADTVIPNSDRRFRVGSQAGPHSDTWDKIDLSWNRTQTFHSGAGLRVASVIPGPGALPPLLVAGCGVALRRRRTP